MPMAIPVIAAWGAAGAAAAAAGGFAAAVGTVGGFMSIAGAALTTIGALTGKRDVMKIGGFMSLGGGLINAAGGAMSAGSAASNAGTAGSVEVADQVYAGSSAADIANAPQLGTVGESAAQGGAGMMGPELPADELSGMSGQRTAVGNMDGLGARADADPIGSRFSSPPGTSNVSNNSPMNGSPMDWLNRIGSTVKQNKEMFQLGGYMLNSTYGPEAQALEMRREEAERRRRNLNTPTSMGMLGSRFAGA